ncbi:GerMN domain-containing protein [Bacillus sp. FJAT-45350]|uniref:GerMN domain-containing protein n=1 Tax=Bacillus sp. FJAT-45350 TaxID=2011014 RepID=UPI000BB6C7FF|nr:GerMN domain-containing protein [Bacillus sp. FJAT-45350]
MKLNQHNREEEKVEALLKQMPTLKDERSKEVILQNIKKRIDEGEQRKRNKSWMVPTLASAAAILLLIIILPSMIQNSEEALPAEDIAEVMEYRSQDVAITMADEDHENTTAVMNETTYVGAVRESELLKGTQGIPFVLTDRDARLVVPVTVIRESSLDEVAEIELLLTEFTGEIYGLNPSPLMGATYSQSADEELTIIVDIRSDAVPTGTADIEMFTQGIEETFAPLGYRKAEFTTDGQPGVQLGNYGEISVIELNRKPRGYYVYYSDNGMPFLVPRARGTSEVGSIEETLELMKDGDYSLGYAPSIPAYIDIVEVAGEDDVVTINLTSHYPLDQIDGQIMIDAILLTANSYGIRTVMFEGLDLNVIGSYHMDEPIDTSIKVNGVNN